MAPTLDAQEPRFPLRHTLSVIPLFIPTLT